MIKQYVQSDFCFQCRGCCRFSAAKSHWLPQLFAEEKKLLGITKIHLLSCGAGFVCAFLNPESERCKIYLRRPFECQLYPFLLQKKGEKIFLAVHLACPQIQSCLEKNEFKKYLNYLVRFFKKKSINALIRKNLDVFATYALREVVSLREIKS